MNTKHRIFQDSDIMLTNEDLRYREKRKNNPKTRQKSYDFFGDHLDRDEERRRKIEARKRNLIAQYKLGVENWTRDTKAVLSQLEKSTQKSKPAKPKPKQKRAKKKTNRNGPKSIGKDVEKGEQFREYSPEVTDPKWVMAEDYEDPKLTKMKHDMKMHEKLRKEIRSRSPLKGDSLYDHEKKVRALKRLLNTSDRSISAHKVKGLSKKIHKKQKGDFKKVNFNENDFLDDEVQRHRPAEKRDRSQRKVSPFKAKYDHQGSFRVAFEPRDPEADEK